MKYEVICWGYDAAPDAEQLYFVGRRKFFDDLPEAKYYAEEQVEHNLFVGASVYEAATKRQIKGYGFTLEYR
jgi:hypothetical protein